MKIRNDYVSNSSSSSYIVVLPNDYDFNKFVKDVVKACSSKKDCDDYEEGFVKRLDDKNRRNLDYCLNNYRLMYLGDLLVGTKQRKIKGKKECAAYLEYRNRVPKYAEIYEDKIISQSEKEIVLEEKHWMYGKAVSWDKLDSLRWRGGNKEFEEKDRKEFVKRVMEFAKREYYEDYSSNCLRDYIGLYEITMETILNTEDLIKEGCELNLDKRWCNLKDLKKRIKDGERIFYITMNQGGEGMDVGSIYALNGWDSDFNSKANVEILSCECG